MQQLLKKLQGDRVIWMVVIFLSLISLLSVYSSVSTAAYRDGSNSFAFMLKHLAILVVGMGVIFIVHKTKFKYFGPLSQVMFWLAVGMLVFTFLFGVEINGAKRWLRIPFTNMTFQTSDFAKIILIVYTARMLNLKRTMLHDFREGVWPVLWPIVLVCALILPDDLSTAVMLGGVCLIMLFIGGVPLRHMAKIIGIALAGVALIYLLGKSAPDLLGRFNTWALRIENFFDPGTTADGNFQSDLGQFSIYKGGFIPQGPFSGSSGRNFLPHPYSDMIYAFIIQEYGSILGGLGLILLYLIFMYRTIKTSLKCPKHFGGIMAMGLGFLITIQALFNMAVSVHLIPVTGQPLPLVSMGGTSILFTCIAIGVILSVSRSVYQPDEWEEENESSPSENKPRESYATN